jgi:hypothetical protein
MNLTRKKSSHAVVGLTLDNGRLEAALLRRSNGTVDVRKFSSTPLTLDLMRNEPELVGREIRNLLDAAGIKERRCVVGLPPEWVLSLHTVLPDLPEEDLSSFLELEAERGFPAGLDQLQRGVSRHRTAARGYATQLAVDSDHVSRLEAVLAAAQLRPAGLSLAITALPGAIADANHGMITALVGEAGVAVLVSAGAGIVALRMLDNVFESEGTERRVLADVIARELRITLAQLPGDLRELLQELQVVGPAPISDALARELEPAARSLGLALRRLTTSNGREHQLEVSGEAPLSAAVSLGVQFLSDATGALNFLPPKPTLWQQISQRYSGRRLAYSGATAGALALIVLGLFLFQGLRLSGLQQEWKLMEAKYTELDKLQTGIRTFRPWFDREITSLTILRQVTESFPETGNVTARALEIRNQRLVNVTGTTTDQTALYAMLNQLRGAAGVREVKVDTIRGNKPPLQFIFNFQWEGRL